MSEIYKIFEDAERNVAAGNISGAIDAYSGLADALPIVAEALFKRGLCHHTAGRHEDAGRDILKSAQIDTKYYSLARNKALGHYVDGLSGPVLNLSINADTVSLEESGEMRSKFWPDGMSINNMPDYYRVTVDEIVSTIPDKQNLIDKSSVIVTFGSCFAVNLGRALKERGFNVQNTLIPEDVNSTYANRHLLDWLIKGNINKFTNYFEVLYGKDVWRSLRETISSASLIIMTIGVAPCLFNARYGEFAFTTRRNDKSCFEYLEGPYKLRTTTVQENVDNLDYNLKMLKNFNDGVRVVLSVSPVPLSGTNEMSSIVIADCLSKCTVRLAAHEITQRFPNIIYWPSFEIVRWLSGHSTFRAFGEDDNHARHVNNSIVNMIIDLFLAKFTQH